MAGNARAATPPQYGEMESAMTCKDHDFPTAICVKCASDGVAECVCTLPCGNCDAPPPADAEQCSLHSGEPCCICDEPVTEFCSVARHLAYELDRQHDLAEMER